MTIMRRGNRRRCLAMEKEARLVSQSSTYVYSPPPSLAMKSERSETGIRT